MTRLLSYDDLRNRGIKYSRTQLWRLIRAGRFPRPVKVAGCANSWLDTEIDALIERAIAERDATHGPEAA